jgi:anti-anti-sigma regulatory factor
MPAFQILKEKLQGGAVLLSVKGFLDAHTFEELEKTIRYLRGSSYKLAVAFNLDASVGRRRRLHRAIGTAGERRKHHPHGQPQREGVFDLLGLSQIFTFKDNRDGAVKRAEGKPRSADSTRVYPGIIRMRPSPP